LLYAKMLNVEGVRVSRRKADLNGKTRKSRYKPEAYTECLLTVLDDLEAMHLLVQVVGDQWRKNYRKVFGFSSEAKYQAQNCKRTVLLHTANLDELVDLYNIHEVSSVGFARERQEVIVQKADESSALVEYEDTDQTRKYRE